jgi:hypothetical protein
MMNALRHVRDSLVGQPAELDEPEVLKFLDWSAADLAAARERHQFPQPSQHATLKHLPAGAPYFESTLVWLSADVAAWVQARRDELEQLHALVDGR